VARPRIDMRRRLFAVAAGQAGFFSAAQARKLGYSYQAQAHHVRAGNWLRVDRGIFRLAEWVPDVDDHLARWDLWSRGRAVVSHATALDVHGIGEFESARVHLTVPPGFTMHDDAVVLHRTALPDTDVAQRDGFRVTMPVRTIVDIAAQAPDEDQLARAVDDARRAGLLTLPDLCARAETVDPRAALYVERAVRLVESA